MAEEVRALIFFPRRELAPCEEHEVRQKMAGMPDFEEEEVNEEIKADVVC